ncbi:MAG: hypothetical protein P0121_02450 [Nitrospira sp.]|nr:hypothetical protein [Nitrospira sp.]
MPKVRSKKPAQPKTRTKTIPYDLPAQLRTPEEMAAYLDAWLEAPDDATGIARALGTSLGRKEWPTWHEKPG